MFLMKPVCTSLGWFSLLARHRGGMRAVMLVLATMVGGLMSERIQAQPPVPLRQEIPGPAIVVFLYPGEPIVLADWYPAQLGVAFQPGVSGLYLGEDVGNGFFELRVHDADHPAAAGGLLVGSARVDSSTPLAGVASSPIAASGPTADGIQVSISGTVVPSAYSLTVILLNGSTSYVVAVGTDLDINISTPAAASTPGTAATAAATTVPYGTSMFVPAEEQPDGASATIVAQRHYGLKQGRYKVYYPGGAVPGGNPSGLPGSGVPGGGPGGAGAQNCFDPCRVNLLRDIALANNAHLACAQSCLLSNQLFLAALGGCATGALVCPAGRVICCAAGATVSALTQYGLCLGTCARSAQAAIDAAHINFVACAALCGIRVVFE